MLENNDKKENAEQKPKQSVKYYYPATKIKSLIHNLDQELKTITQQCTVRKTEVRQVPTPEITTFATYPLHPLTYAQDAPNNSSNMHIRNLSTIYRAKVIDAYRNRRIFTIFGNYNTVRRALLNRGWLEKLSPNRLTRLQALSEEVLLTNAKRGNDFETAAISKMINHFPAFFVWQQKGMRDYYADVSPYRNRVRRSGNMDFTTKVGLIGCAEQEHWFRQEGLCRMSYPRFYRLGGSTEERAAFVEDFRRTQCRCLIRYVWENITNSADLTDVEEGTIELNVLEFAMDRITEQLKEFELDEASKNFDENPMDWNGFNRDAVAIIKGNAKFKCSLNEILVLAREGRVLLDQIEQKRIDYRWDGTRNLWILKPGFSCRGIGIIIRSSLDDIMHWVNNNSNRRYIAQKYIERPLLIYRTKFDIRQYMLLVISESVVSVWLYRDCYLRFSSQEFSIDDLRESIHLTNNSVQKKYRSKPNRDHRLPKNNMWTLEQFKAYLRLSESSDHMWNDRVYKGFRENLIAVVMASMEETDFVPNAFELYGCDFMLDEHYNPILIEINSTPDLSPSTDVTAHLCPMVLRDLIKVVVDRPHNHSIATGLFELVYEINYKTERNFDPNVGLPINGKTMTLHSHKRRLIPYRKSFFTRNTKKIKELQNTDLVDVPKKSALNSMQKPNTPRPQIYDIKKVSTKISVKSPRSQIVKKKVPTLKPFAKEALALRYTIPK